MHAFTPSAGAASCRVPETQATDKCWILDFRPASTILSGAGCNAFVCRPCLSIVTRQRELPTCAFPPSYPPWSSFRASPCWRNPGAGMTMTARPIAATATTALSACHRGIPHGRATRPHAAAGASRGRSPTIVGAMDRRSWTADGGHTWSRPLPRSSHSPANSRRARSSSRREAASSFSCCPRRRPTVTRSR